MTISTVYAEETDGTISSTASAITSAYGSARSGSNLAADASNAYRVYHFMNQLYNYVYYFQEGFMEFDTSGLGSDATISDVVFSSWGENMYNPEGHSIMELRLYTWTVPLGTGDFIPGADLSGNTLLATFATSSGYSTSGYNAFVDVAFPANINKTGTTFIMSSNDDMRRGDVPSTHNSAGMVPAETSGSDKDAKLVITFTVPSKPRYTFTTIGVGA